MDGTAEAQIGADDHADWTYGTGDVTLDMWVRFAGSAGNDTFISQRADGDNTWQWYMQGNVMVLYVRIGGTTLTNTEASWTPTAGTWYHIALVRSSGVVKFYVDGTALTKSTDIGGNANWTDIGAALRIGAWQSGSQYDFTGHMDEIRIVKGTAVWTANFTPPTSEYVPADP
jgi:hypothetical protein